LIDHYSLGEPSFQKLLSEPETETTFKSQQKPVGVGAACQPLIPTGKRCGLLARIATESVSLYTRMKS
jgi:hypothetical protein